MLEQSERRIILVRALIEAIEPIIDAGTPYAALSVERIIRAVGVSRATFYSYFKDKGDLLRAMAEDLTADIGEGSEAWWRLADNAGRDELREALRPAIDAYLQHRILIRAVAETAAYDDHVRETYGALMSQTIDHLSAHITGQQARGLAAPELDPERTATWLVWMLERGFYQAVSIADPDAVEPWVESLTDLIWRMVYAGARPELRRAAS